MKAKTLAQFCRSESKTGLVFIKCMHQWTVYVAAVWKLTLDWWKLNQLSTNYIMHSITIVFSSKDHVYWQSCTYCISYILHWYSQGSDWFHFRIGYIFRFTKKKTWFAKFGVTKVTSVPNSNGCTEPWPQTPLNTYGMFWNTDQVFSCQCLTLQMLSEHKSPQACCRLS